MQQLQLRSNILPGRFPGGNLAQKAKRCKCTRPGGCDLYPIRVMSVIDQRRQMKALDMRLASGARPGFNHSYEGRFDETCNKFQRYIDDERAFATTHEPAVALVNDE